MSIVTVRLGGRFCSNAVATFCASGRGAEVVGLSLRKPFWVSAEGRPATSSGRMRRFSTLMSGLRKEIGLEEVSRLRGKPALAIGTITACFHIGEMLASRRDSLYRSTKYWMPLGPSCLR